MDCCGPTGFDLHGSLELDDVVSREVLTEGLMGSTARHWVRKMPGGDARTVIVKQACRSPGAATIGLRFDTLGREVLFYEQVHAAREFAPACIGVSHRAGGTVMVLEDTGSTRAAPSVADVQAVITTLAHLQARTILGTPPHATNLLRLFPPSPGDRSFLVRLGRRGLRHYARNMSSSASATTDRAEAVSAAVCNLSDRLPAGPLALCHGDLRPANVVFRPTGRVTFIDWQTYRLDLLGVDLACLIGTSLPPGPRQAAEVELVENYRTALASHGVHLDPWPTYHLGALISGLTLFGEWSLLMAEGRADTVFGEPLHRMLELMSEAASVS